MVELEANVEVLWYILMYWYYLFWYHSSLFFCSLCTSSVAIYYNFIFVIDRGLYALAGRWLSCAHPRQCPKSYLTLYQRKKEVCSVRSRGSPWQRSRLASPRKRPGGRESFSREKPKARYERGRVRYTNAYLLTFLARALIISMHNWSCAYLCRISL